jgi:hypothetical protein
MFLFTKFSCFFTNSYDLGKFSYGFVFFKVRKKNHLQINKTKNCEFVQYRMNSCFNQENFVRIPTFSRKIHATEHHCIQYQSLKMN